jgi:hypothetical protein
MKIEHNNNFSHDLDFGKWGESIVAQLLDNSLVEVKTERASNINEEKKWVTTGNHFVEYAGRDNKPSGISVTKAKWWFVNFTIADNIIFGNFISVEMLKYKLKKGNFKRVIGGDLDTNGKPTAKGILFPIKEFYTWEK